MKSVVDLWLQIILVHKVDLRINAANGNMPKINYAMAPKVFVRTELSSTRALKL
jgi:hypothetical protein